jgi:hypothetical protein
VLQLFGLTNTKVFLERCPDCRENDKKKEEENLHAAKMSFATWQAQIDTMSKHLENVTDEESKKELKNMLDRCHILWFKKVTAKNVGFPSEIEVQELYTTSTKN